MNLEQCVVVEVDRIAKLDDLNNLNFIKQIYGFHRVFENIVIHKDLSITGSQIYAADYGFYQCFSKDYPMEGEWIEGPDQCVIDAQIHRKYGIELGAEITVGNNNYKVAGILHMPHFASTIIIPKALINENRLNRLTLYLKYEGKLTEDNRKDLDAFLIKKAIDYRIGDANMILSTEKNKLQRGWEPTIAISIIALLYGIVNIKNIEKFYFVRRKLTYGIILAYGASKKHIFFIMYLESGFLAFLSSILTYCGAYLLQYSRLNYIISMRVDVIIFFVILVLGQCYSILYSLLNLHSLYRKNVSGIFRNVIE